MSSWQVIYIAFMILQTEWYLKEIAVMYFVPFPSPDLGDDTREKPNVYSKPSAATARTFCKTEWTKPRFVDKPYCERRMEPAVEQAASDPATSCDKVQYGELSKIWEELQYELYNASLNGNKLIFTSTVPCQNKINVKENEECVACDSLDEEKEEKRRQVDAIMRTYFELARHSAPYVKKWRHPAVEELEHVTLYTEAGEPRVNTTTANQEEAEKLTQKVETIEEVPLVEAEPDIIKPPRTTGPTVMNISNQTFEMVEDSGINSDFQVYDELVFDDPKARALAQATSTPNNDAKYYCESTKNYNKNSDFNDLFLNAVLPEIKLDQCVPLSELLQRVRLRNRLLRCYEIQIQLATAESTDIPSSPRPPMYDHRPLNPPGYMPKPHTVPIDPWPQHPKSEPITPDNRPCPSCPRRTNVSPVNLALYLGPLISPFRNASLFPLMTFGMKLFPIQSNYQVKLTDMVEVLKHFSDILSVYGTLEASDLQVNFQPSS